MMKKLIAALILFLFAGVLIYILREPEPEPSYLMTAGPRDIAYEIEGEEVLLQDGVAEKRILPDSASNVITRYFGNEVSADMDQNGMEDMAFLLTVNGGGSGTFYYLVVALRHADGYHGTNAIFIGDRIAPQTTEYRAGEIIVNYAERAPGEPMSVRPSVGVSKYFAIREGKLVEAKK